MSNIILKKTSHTAVLTLNKKSTMNALCSEFIEEIGDGIKKASTFAGDKLGEVASGTWDVAAGIITQDESQLNEGFKDIGQAAGDTAKALGSSVCNVVENGVTVNPN